ncbi:MAG: acyl-CoA dehydrogenase [Saccharothrix sp.]|nr:acyl-CoA dehydrogenase [Saccharothrix sp.]
MLRVDAAERDRANRPPTRELAALRKTCLLTVDPDDHVTTHAVVRTVSAADPSLGHLLGYHYLHLWRAKLFANTALAAGMRAGTAEHGWFWGGVGNQGDALRATPTARGYSISGTRTFATGASVADRLVVHVTRDDGGERFAAVVRADAPGLTHPPDWDNVGQRLSASGSVVFDEVGIDHAAVLGPLPAGEDDPRLLRLSLSALSFQSVLTQVLVGIAEGALAEAAAYTGTHTRAWPSSGVDRAVRDPYVLAGYGELVAATRAAVLLAERAAVAFQHADDQGAALTPAQRGAAGVAISEAKVVATRTVLDTTSRVFEHLGARATATRHGFDRFWRNARTLTLHDPVVYKAREVGAHFLTGDLPPLTSYS